VVTLGGERLPITFERRQPQDRGDVLSERLIDRFAPEAMVPERHEIVTRAPAEIVLEVAEAFDLMSIPAVYAIFWHWFMESKMLRGIRRRAEKRCERD
jgi:hypothetical protein